MAMVVDAMREYELGHDQLDLMDYSTTTWDGWSPEWETTVTGQKSQIQDLIKEGITQENSTGDPTHIHMLVDEEIASAEDFKGLRLVHLLMAGAEALDGVNKNRELARVILVRLKELVSVTNGTKMERLAAHFTEALHGLVEENHHHHHKHYHNNHLHQLPLGDVVASFQLLQDISPHIKFGHFTANQAILEAVEQDKRIHIVDYDIMEGIQWASLMQGLVSNKTGPSCPHLRITALSRTRGGARRSMVTVQQTGRRLVAFAGSIGLPFSFHQCRLNSEEGFRPLSLKLVKGESLIMNCMLQLPHFRYRGSDSIASFLMGAKVLNPKLITLVEEEVGLIGPQGGFVGRFMDSLHHYSALYDSLEAGFPMQGQARALVERVFFAPRITGSLARLYRANEKEESGLWAERLLLEGFGPKIISFANHCQAKLLLGLYNDGYGVEEVSCNRLVLGWKSRRLLSASIWKPPCNSDSD